VSSYLEPRTVVLRVTDTDRMTLLEFGRALAAVDVRVPEVGPLLRAAFRPELDADPATFERGLELAYAIAWQLERRADPSISWEEAQTWDVQPAAPTPAEIEAARILTQGDELVAKVAAGTGLPPEVAGALTMSQVGALGAARSGGSRTARRQRARVRR